MDPSTVFSTFIAGIAALQLKWGTGAITGDQYTTQINALFVWYAKALEQSMLGQPVEAAPKV